MIEEIKGDIMVQENPEAMSSLQIPRENPGDVYALSSKIEKFYLLLKQVALKSMMKNPDSVINL